MTMHGSTRMTPSGTEKVEFPLRRIRRRKKANHDGNRSVARDRSSPDGNPGEEGIFLRKSEVNFISGKQDGTIKNSKNLRGLEAPQLG